MNFAANIRNPHTRRAYYRAAEEFLAWCASEGVPSIAAVQTGHVATWIEMSGRELAAPSGRHRAVFAAAAEGMFAEDFAGRVLPFEARAAARYPEIVLARPQAGNPIEKFDAMIAATALAVGASIATRDAGGFAGCGLTVINPWTA